jgi:hypothetical protein
VGYLPVNLAAPAIAAGRLVHKRVEDESDKLSRLTLAWRPRDVGKGLKWWLAKLDDVEVRRRLLS